MPNNFTLRPYAPSDCPALAALFYDTVHTVAAADYTPAQLDAWADGRPDLAAWDASFRAHRTLVAVEGRTIIGFADLAPEQGYLDRLYVHKDRQRRGVASALCAELEAACPTPRARRGRFSSAAATACCVRRPWSAMAWRLKIL